MVTRNDVLVEALQKAAAVFLQHDPADRAFEVKTTAGDVVTAADLASEAAIIDTIMSAFPDDLLISEEITANHRFLTPEHRRTLTAWVIDPLDGSYNFTRGMSYSGISIAYIKDGVPEIGGVIDPYRNHLYIARNGHGVTCNGQSIRVAQNHVFNLATRVCTSNSSLVGGTQQNLLRYTRLGDVWVDVLGSAVLIMADIASGRLDLYHHNGLKPWDNAAAFLILQEASAKIVGLHGQPVTWLTSEIVTGNPVLVDLFVQRMRNQ